MLRAPHQNSKITVELGELISSGMDLWNFDYPSFYQGEQKQKFEQKVIDHFWFRQIGAETPGRFLHFFKRTMREIMPYYIQRYKSVEMMNDPEIKPLDNYNMIEEYTSTAKNANTTESESEDTATSKGSENVVGGSGTAEKVTEVHSDTPQGKLNISIPAYPLAENTAETISSASDVRQNLNGSQTTENHDTTTNSTNTGSSKATAKVEGDSTETHRLTRHGNIGVTTYAQLLEGYRQTFLNIDMEIIGELESCFLGVF